MVSQNGHVTSYESRKMKEHEKNYATHDLDLTINVPSLKVWRHYFMGKKFELRIHHDGLN